MNTRQSDNAGTTNRRRVPILSIFVVLDAFVLGGLVALFMVNGFLSDHVARYAQGNLVAQDTITNAALWRCFAGRLDRAGYCHRVGQSHDADDAFSAAHDADTDRNGRQSRAVLLTAG